MVRAAALSVVVLLAAACAGPGDAPTDPAAGSAGSDGSIDPRLLEPLVGLGPCEDPPPPGEHAGLVDDMAGVVLPPTAVVTFVNDTGPLTQIRGYVERTPVEIRAFYSEGGADVQVLTIEDEIREVEALLTDGETRLFVKGQAVCERGSFFVAFLAPAGRAELLPTPAQGGN